jgi:hypothetical protein
MNPKAFSEKINPYVHAILIDRMNYVSQTLKTYELMNLNRWLDKGFIDGMIDRLKNGFAGKDVRIC